MRCKEGDDANGHSLRQEPDTADRLQSQCPKGLQQKLALAVLRSLASRIATTCVARLAIIQFLLATRFMADLIRGSLTLRLSGTAQKRAAPYFYVRASILPYGFLYGKVLVFAYGKYSL